MLSVSVVDVQEGAYGELTESKQEATSGHSQTAIQPLVPHPAAPSSKSVGFALTSAPPLSSSTSLSTSVSTSAIAPSFDLSSSSILPAASSTSSTGSTATLPPATRSSQLNQPSRQRSSAALLASTSSSVPSAAIDIDEKQPLVDSDRQHSATRRGGRRKGEGKGRGWRVEQVIACLMIACFVGSVVLYAVVSSQWKEIPSMSRTGR